MRSIIISCIAFVILVVVFIAYKRFGEKESMCKCVGDKCTCLGALFDDKRLTL